MPALLKQWWEDRARYPRTVIFWVITFLLIEVSSWAKGQCWRTVLRCDKEGQCCCVSVLQSQGRRMNLTATCNTCSNTDWNTGCMRVRPCVMVPANQSFRNVNSPPCVLTLLKDQQGSFQLAVLFEVAWMDWEQASQNLTTQALCWRDVHHLFCQSLHWHHTREF